VRVWRAKEAKVCLVGETKVARVATGARYEPLVLSAPYCLSRAEFTHAVSPADQGEAWAYSADQGAAYQLVREHPVTYLVVDAMRSIWAAHPTPKEVAVPPEMKESGRRYFLRNRNS
jgi:hypothetical protein